MRAKILATLVTMAVGGLIVAVAMWHILGFVLVGASVWLVAYIIVRDP